MVAKHVYACEGKRGEGKKWQSGFEPLTNEITKTNCVPSDHIRAPIHDEIGFCHINIVLFHTTTTKMFSKKKLMKKQKIKIILLSGKKT